jgi:hypothetical protein
MTDLPHLRLENTATSVGYVSAGGGGGVEFQLPPRDRRQHARRLRAELERAEADARSKREEQGLTAEADGAVLAIRSNRGFELKLDSLERRRSGIELLSVSLENGVTIAKVFVPRGKYVVLLGLIESYRSKNSAAGKPRNQELVESIASIRLAAVRDFWEDTPDLFPRLRESIWWEVWLRNGREELSVGHARFSALARDLGLRVSDRSIGFPERTVTHLYGTQEQLGGSMDLLAMLAELRRAKDLATVLVELPPREQADIVQRVLSRLVPPTSAAPSVCILDGGVNREHPLLAPALAPDDTQSVNLAEWGVADDHEQHGTGMAGIALFGCLTDVVASGGPVNLRHRLESVKILPPPPQQNDEKDYGPITVQAVALAEIQAPGRNRAICMAVTADDRDLGLPTAWSAAIDQMCSGALDDGQRLMFISAGNIRTIRDPSYEYHRSNMEHGIEDPAQSWNAITVGAYTEKVIILDPTFSGWEPVAPDGDLCPTSRTSLSWPAENQRGWPNKPDIVMEGGNYAALADEISTCPDLSLLTTSLRPGSGELLEIAHDTSPATAAAARMAATVWAKYPRLQPETVRGLMVHSASWTPAMSRRYPQTNKTNVQNCLRCYGYGVPELSRALWSAENSATLIFEGELQPFHRVASEVRSNEMHVHRLPWPVDVLEALGELDVSMRVTLSYFVEPSPGRIGWTKKHRYQSHGLRFDVKRPTEDEQAFRQRLSRAEWADRDDRPENVVETRNWTVGEHGRTRGAIHSDWWTGTASELASCGLIAVYPVIGWWRERAHLRRFDRQARYSLIVTLSTADEQVDLYTPILSQSEITTEVETE